MWEQAEEGVQTHIVTSFKQYNILPKVDSMWNIAPSKITIPHAWKPPQNLGVKVGDLSSHVQYRTECTEMEIWTQSYYKSTYFLGERLIKSQDFK